jgi:hypothetical protein
MDSWVIEELSVKFHRIDREHWPRIVSLQVDSSRIDNLDAFSLKTATLKPRPCKRPLHLKAALTAYARQLFEAEARKYPADTRLARWLSNLVDRMAERVIASVNKIERKSHPRSNSYHGVSVPEIRESIQLALKSSVLDFLQRRAPVRPRPEIQPLASTHGKNSIASISRPIKDQLSELMDESRQPIERISEGIEVTPRSVYRHLSGEALPRKRQLAAYEQFFSKKLGRTICFKMPVGR